MRSLYYENLNDPQLIAMQKWLPLQLRVFWDYLNVTLDHLKKQTLEVSWSKGSVPENYKDSTREQILEVNWHKGSVPKNYKGNTNNGKWVHIQSKTGNLPKTQLKTLFELGSIIKIYENPRGETLSKVERHPRNSLKVLDQDRDSEQLLLDRLPNDGFSLEVVYDCWVRIHAVEGDLSIAQLKILFDQGSIKEIYEKALDETLSKMWYNPRNSLRVLDKDRDSEQLLLDKLPRADSSLVVRPNTYVVENQREAVKQLQERPTKEHKPLLRLFSQVKKTNWPKSIPDNSIENWHFLTDDDLPGTEQQRDFVHKALGTPDFALLEGPPGSGKTTAICELITQAILRDQRILLCASTHVAVDNVIERLMANDEKAKEIIPVRIGDENNISDDVRRFTYQNLYDSECERIQKYINKLNSPSKIQKNWTKLLHNNQLDKDKKATEMERIILDSTNLICGTTIGILQHPAIKDKNRPRPLYDLLIIDEASKTTFQEFLVPALFAKKWILVGDPQQLSPYVDSGELAANLAHILSERDRNAAFDVFSATEPIGSRYRSSLIQCSSEKEKEEYADIYKEFAEEKNLLISDSVDDKTVFADILLLTESEIEGNREKLPLDLATLRNVSDERISNRARAWHRKRHDLAPKWEKEIAWRILNEYAQRMASGSKGVSKLQAVIDSLIPGVRRNSLKKDLEGLRRIALPSILECLQNGISRDRKADGSEYDGTFLTDGFPLADKQPRHTILEYQHRMHPQISEFPRRYIYNNKALHDPDYMTAKKELTPPLWYSNRSHWLNVHSEFNQKNNSNEKEANQIINELRRLGKWKETSNSDLKTVAILTFYRGQERLLRSKLQELTKKKKNFRHFYFMGLTIDLCTVDRFQGHEADIVFLSFVKDHPTPFLQSPNRLNVALTRARFQLVIVGNRVSLAKGDSILCKLCEHHKKMINIHLGGDNE